LLAAAWLPAHAESFVVPATLWERPRTAADVLALAPVRQAMDLYLARPSAVIIVHHRPGQEPLIEAEELRAWLMALAVEASRIRLASDRRAGEPIVLEVTQ
jgi:hypothetical protein